MLFLILAVFLLSANAQVPVFTSCPDLPTMPRFDVERYLGKWYEIEKLFMIFELGGKCIKAEYSKGENEGEVTVKNTQINAFSGTETTITGVARVADESNPSKLVVEFPTLPVANEAPYWVLDTDYSNYSVVFACNDLGELSLQYGWILARDRKPSFEALERAYTVLELNNINLANFQRTDQSNCPEE